MDPANHPQAGPSSARVLPTSQATRDDLGLGQPRTGRPTKARAISARQRPLEQWRFSVPVATSLADDTTPYRSKPSRSKQAQRPVRDRSKERYPLSSSYASTRADRGGLSNWTAIADLMDPQDDDHQQTPTSALARLAGNESNTDLGRSRSSLHSSSSALHPRSYATFSGPSTPSGLSRTSGRSEPPSPSPFISGPRKPTLINQDAEGNSASKESIFTPMLPPVSMIRNQRRLQQDVSSPSSSSDDDTTPLAEHRDLYDGLLSSSPSAMNAFPASGQTPSLETSNTQHNDGEQSARHPTESVFSSESQPLLGSPAVRTQPLLRNQSRRYLTATVHFLTHPSPAFVAIFKCSLAYLIASLFTFVPALSRTLSRSSEIDAHGRVTPIPAYSAHMVATIVVYFNPAKTLGHMILATRYCFVLALYAALFCLASMATMQIFDSYSPSGPDSDRWDWVKGTGDWIVCVLWIGGSVGLLAWLKGWVGNPSFNTGCSMAAVILFTVVVKQGGIPKLLEVLAIVLIGATITNVICFVIWPISATSRLQRSITTSLTSFRTLLSLLTSTFLLDQPSHTAANRTTLRNAVEAHAKAFRTLKADLAEAKNERAIDGRIGGARRAMYDVAVQSLTRLAQHLTGLRSGTGLQEELLKASREGRIVVAEPPDKGNTPHGRTTPQPASPSQAFFSPSAKEATLQDYFGEDGRLAAQGNLFVDFRDAVGPEMRALEEACSQALTGVQEAFTARKTLVRTPEPTHTIAFKLVALKTGVDSALKAFSKSSNRAIKRLYAAHPRRQKEVYLNGDEQLSSEHSDVSSDEDDSSEESVALREGPNEAVFLIYFFLFTLEEFARELSFLCENVADLADESIATRVWLDNLKIFLTFGLWKGPVRGKVDRRRALRKRMSRLVPIDPSKLQPSVFPKHARDAPGTLLTPSRETLTRIDQIYHSLWALGAGMREPDVRYAVKTGVATAMLAAPAFTNRYRPIFLEYRGEWALIAFFATMSPTLGQTNFLSLFRILGTLLGAAGAVVIYTIFPENPVMLPILGWAFSIPCFWIITQRPAYAQAGRFILLTYNLTCLYAYNQRDKDLHATTIALRRATSVIVGVCWAALVSRYWWPYTARKELRNGLSDFCLDLSYLYSRLVSSYSGGQRPAPSSLAALEANSTETSIGVNPTHINSGIREFMAMELHLQRQLLHLRDLLAQTKNEPRIKGPFAYRMYDEILLSCERMLDRLHSMRCVTTREEWDQHMRKAFVIPVNSQRREMDGNVILFFYTLSAAFRLRTPLPPYLPPAEDSRDRLVSAIRNLDVVKRRSVRGGGRHLLFFAHALAMKEIISELEFLGESLQEAFGVISQSAPTDFDALFATGN